MNKFFLPVLCCCIFVSLLYVPGGSGAVTTCDFSRGSLLDFEVLVNTTFQLAEGKQETRTITLSPQLKTVKGQANLFSRTVSRAGVQDLDLFLNQTMNLTKTEEFSKGRFWENKTGGYTYSSGEYCYLAVFGARSYNTQLNGSVKLLFREEGRLWKEQGYKGMYPLKLGEQRTFNIIPLDMEKIEMYTQQEDIVLESLQLYNIPSKIGAFLVTDHRLLLPETTQFEITNKGVFGRPDDELFAYGDRKELEFWEGLGMLNAFSEKQFTKIIQEVNPVQASKDITKPQTFPQLYIPNLDNRMWEKASTLYGGEFDTYNVNSVDIKITLGEKLVQTFDQERRNQQNFTQLVWTLQQSLSMASLELGGNPDKYDKYNHESSATVHANLYPTIVASYLLDENSFLIHNVKESLVEGEETQHFQDEGIRLVMCRKEDKTGIGVFVGLIFIIIMVAIGFSLYLSLT